MKSHLNFRGSNQKPEKLRGHASEKSIHPETKFHGKEATRNTNLKKFKHLCPRCGESLHNGEPIELHHIIPKKAGGKHSMNNTQPLHRVCHQQITPSDKQKESYKLILNNLKIIYFPL